VLLQQQCSCFVLDLAQAALYGFRMWNSPDKHISQSDIRTEYLRVLKTAVMDAQDFDVRSARVYNALDYLQERSSRSWGFTLFREGLECWDIPAMQKGLALIHQHLGLANASH